MSKIDENGLWFTTAQVKLHLAQQDNRDGLSLMEHHMPEGFSPPLHVHHGEAETFHVLEGRFLFQAGDARRVLETGEAIHVPAGTPHSFKVLSAEGGRMLTMTSGGFEAAVRRVSRPATVDGLPENLPPTPAEQALLASVMAEHGIDLIGAPL